MKTPADAFADLLEPVEFSPMYGDDLPDPAEFNDPLALCIAHEQDLIQSFGWNLNGSVVK